MPAALYDYCRKGEQRPIKVGGGFVIPTDRQTQDLLLCEDCEDVLNSGGERWILVVIEKPQKAQITMNDPYEGVRQGWRTHFVHVPGVLFMMALGKTVDDSVRSLSITKAGNPINVSDALTEDFEKLMVETLRKSHKTQAYLRAKAKADADRKTQS